jgi:hypothetical protein
MGRPAFSCAGSWYSSGGVPGQFAAGHSFAGAQERTCVDSVWMVRWSDRLGGPGLTSTYPARPFASILSAEPKDNGSVHLQAHARSRRTKRYRERDVELGICEGGYATGVSVGRSWDSTAQRWIGLGAQVQSPHAAVEWLRGHR